MCLVLSKQWNHAKLYFLHKLHVLFIDYIFAGSGALTLHHHRTIYDSSKGNFCLSFCIDKHKTSRTTHQHLAHKKLTWPFSQGSLVHVVFNSNIHLYKHQGRYPTNPTRTGQLLTKVTHEKVFVLRNRLWLFDSISIWHDFQVFQWSGIERAKGDMTLTRWQGCWMVNGHTWRFFFWSKGTGSIKLTFSKSSKSLINIPT